MTISNDRSAAPVLGTEKQEHYEALVAALVTHLNPKDVIEVHLVESLADSISLIKRYTRFQTVAVERRRQQSIDYQVRRLKVQAARQGCVSTELADLDKEAKEILNRAPTEMEYVRALEKSAAFQDQLEKRLKNEIGQFEHTLDFFEYYREGLGKRLQEASEKILEPNHEAAARLEQSELPNLVPELTAPIHR
jgi:hypothetical protein